jgi:hypothetical protein
MPATRYCRSALNRGNCLVSILSCRAHRRGPLEAGRRMPTQGTEQTPLTRFTGTAQRGQAPGRQCIGVVLVAAGTAAEVGPSAPPTTAVTRHW